MVGKDTNHAYLTMKQGHEPLGYRSGSEIMVVSHFYASTERNRPSQKRLNPDIAIPMYKAFCEEVGLQLGKTCTKPEHSELI